MTVTNLGEQLSKRRLAMRDDVRAVYETVVAELASRGLLDDVLAVGQHFPDVALPSATGEFLRLSDLWCQGPLVVTFFRGEWCPYCRLMLTALEEALPEIEALQGRIVAVTPETGGAALTAKAHHGERYEILSDVDCGLGLNCGVVFRTPQVYRDLLLGRGNNVAERHGNDAWFLPIPAAFVVDRQGIVSWRYADVDFTRRAEPADIIDAVRRLSEPIG